MREQRPAKFSMRGSKLVRRLLLVCLLVSMGCSARRDTHEWLNAALWAQTAAEHDVLCALAYRQAHASLDLALADPSWTAALEQQPGYEKLPPAIIVDLDETVLDNSPFEGRQIRDRKVFDEARWNEWVRLHAAEALPGAVEFLQYAASKHVAIFYITNRTAPLEEATRTNLADLKLPVAALPDVVLTKDENGWTSSDKSARRSVVAKDYRILLSIGDDLRDFVAGAEVSPDERLALAESHSARWGREWILLPNAIYGSWDSALYGQDFSLSDAAILRRKFEAVKGF